MVAADNWKPLDFVSCLSAYVTNFFCCCVCLGLFFAVWQKLPWELVKFLKKQKQQGQQFSCPADQALSVVSLLVALSRVRLCALLYWCILFGLRSLRVCAYWDYYPRFIAGGS